MTVQVNPSKNHPVHQIPFHNWLLIGVEIDGQLFVAIKPICEIFGLAWNAQFEKIKRDPVLNSGIRVTRIPAKNNQSQQAVTLPVEFLTGWLFQINVSRTKLSAEQKEALITFQKESYLALHNYWQNKKNPPAPAIDNSEFVPALRNALLPDLIGAVAKVFDERLIKSTLRPDDVHQMDINVSALGYNGISVRDKNLIMSAMRKKTGCPAKGNCTADYFRLRDLIHINFGVKAMNQLRKQDFNPVMRMVNDFDPTYTQLDLLGKC